MCAYLCKEVFRGTWEDVLRVGELAQSTHTSVRMPRLQVMLPRGQKQRTEASGDLWERARGAVAEARGKPTALVPGKRKQLKAGQAGQAVQLPLSEASRTLFPWSFHWTFYGSLDPAVALLAGLHSRNFCSHCLDTFVEG